MMNKPILVQLDGRTVNNELGYPDCSCGRSSRWYDGITKTSHWYDSELEEEFSASKFTCIFCLSNLEEDSKEAIAIYGTAMGGKHLFFKELPY